jgi:hypothetical protein
MFYRILGEFSIINESETNSWAMKLQLHAEAEIQFLCNVQKL